MASSSDAQHSPTGNLSSTSAPSRDANEQIDMVTALRSPPSLPRRSHSERATLPSASSRPLLMPRFDHDLPPLPLSQMSPEERRRSIVAMDRKRRLTSTSQETGRRRTTAGGFTSRNSQYYNASSPRSYHNDRETSNRTQPEVIDLTGSPPEQRSQLPTRTAPSPSRSSRYVLPRWQPNEEATECPICHRPFSFLFRRHHCRKCGRVVCDACSPHRITIPRQYIVHPPGAESESLTPSVDFVRDDNKLMYQNIGGGEKVRLCNPCVPDPQPEPQLPQSRPPNAFAFAAPTLGQQLPPNYSPFLSHPAHQSHYSAPAYDGLFTERNSASQPYSPFRRVQPNNRYPYVSNSEDDGDSGSSPEQTQHTPPAFVLPPQHQDPPRAGHSRFHSLQGPLPNLPLGRRPFIPPSFSPSHGRHLTGHSSQFAHILNSPARSAEAQIAAASVTQPPTRRRYNEDDICPVCRRILPDKGPEGDTRSREQHVMDCIAMHIGGASSTPPTRSEVVAVQDSGRGSATSTPSQAATPISSSLPAQPTRRTSQLPPAPVFAVAAAAAAASSSSSSSRQAHQPGMVRFTATEKDCIADSEDNPPECSICMVEYEPGDKLVRLECWCKFHEECIVQWVVGRGGSCPLHKISS